MADGDWTSSIVVEDGTGTNPAANSYISIADARTLNTLRGLPFPVIGVLGTDPDATNDALAQAALMRAMDYIESFSAKWIGTVLLFDPVTSEPLQPLTWPRSYPDPLAAPVYGGPGWGFCPPTATGVAKAIKTAQARLASIIGSGVDLYPVTTGPLVIEEEIGPIKTTYNPLYGTTTTPTIPEIVGILGPYLSNFGDGYLQSYRA